MLEFLKNSLWTTGGVLSQVRTRGVMLDLRPSLDVKCKSNSTVTNEM